MTETKRKHVKKRQEFTTPHIGDMPRLRSGNLDYDRDLEHFKDRTRFAEREACRLLEENIELRKQLQVK